VMSIWAEPLLQCAGAVAEQLLTPQLYIQAVLGGAA